MRTEFVKSIFQDYSPVFSLHGNFVPKSFNTFPALQCIIRYQVSGFDFYISIFIAQDAFKTIDWQAGSAWHSLALIELQMEKDHKTTIGCYGINQYFVALICVLHDT